MEITLGKRIVQNRKRMGLTQDQLAERLGVTAQAVSKWENDQSCPDITTLPKLAAIFGITTDELLGHEPPPAVHEVEVVDDREEGDIGGHVGKWEFKFDSGRRSALCFALTVLSVGVLYLLSSIFRWHISFWGILWPTALGMFGLFGLYPRFSFFRFGCLIFGAYSLLINLDALPFGLGSDLVWPTIIILFGLGLLADALKKPRKAKVQVKGKSDKRKEQLSMDADSFDFSASFGESTQHIALPCLRGGSVSTSFGSYKLDFSGVEALAEDCALDVNCAFGELVLLIPSRYTVRPTTSTAFAEFAVKGEPDAETQGTLYLSASASFGEICVRYI